MLSRHLSQNDYDGTPTVKSTSYCYRNEAHRHPSCKGRGRSCSLDLNFNSTEEKHLSTIIDKNAPVNRIIVRMWSTATDETRGERFTSDKSRNPLLCFFGSIILVLAVLDTSVRFPVALRVVEVVGPVLFKPDGLAGHEAELVCLSLGQLRHFLRTENPDRTR